MMPAIRPLLLLSVAALALAACATQGTTVRSQTEPGADFSAYQSFGFFDEQPGQAPLYASFVDKRIKDAIVAEMGARGYRREKDGQLMINYHRQAKESVQVTQTAVPTGGYYGYRRGFYGFGSTAVTTDVRKLREGSILIDVVDIGARKLLWHSVAVARVDKKVLENPEPVIDAAVKQMFTEFPGGRSPAP